MADFTTIFANCDLFTTPFALIAGLPAIANA